MEGNFAATFIVVFREALEAALIVGIIMTFLLKLNARRYFPHVIASTVVAIGVSIVAGFWLHTLTSGLQGQISKLIEGVISLVACGILTYMVFWMDAQARKIKPEIETQLEGALTQNQVVAILALPFFAVFREGAETVLFLKAIAIQSGGSASLLGGLGGTALAIAIVAAIFVWGRRIPLRPLFRGTGVLILLIAAGLLAYGIHELQEIGWVPWTIYPVWNTNGILNEKVGLGAFLKALFGYNGNPSLIEVLAYWTFIGGIIYKLKKLSNAPT